MKAVKSHVDMPNKELEPPSPTCLPKVHERLPNSKNDTPASDFKIDPPKHTNDLKGEKQAQCQIPTYPPPIRLHGVPPRPRQVEPERASDEQRSTASDRWRIHCRRTRFPNRFKRTVQHGGLAERVIRQHSVMHRRPSSRGGRRDP